MIPTLRLVLLASALCLPSLALAQEEGATSADQAEQTLEPGEEEALLQYLEANSPERYRKAKLLMEQNPQAYRALLAKVSQHMEKADPERVAQRQRLKATKAELGTLAEGYQELSNSEQKTRRAEIETLCEEIFALRQEHRRQQLVTLQEKLEELSAEIDERDRRKDELIEEFVGQMLGESRKIEGL